MSTFLLAHAAKPLKAYKKVWVLLTYKCISNVNQKTCNIWQLLKLQKKWKISFVELIHLMILICKSCENTCEKLVNLSYSDSQCPIVAKARYSTETFLKSNKLTEHLALRSHSKAALFTNIITLFSPRNYALESYSNHFLVTVWLKRTKAERNSRLPIQHFLGFFSTC